MDFSMFLAKMCTKQGGEIKWDFFSNIKDMLKENNCYQYNIKLVFLQYHLISKFENMKGKRDKNV